jgi:hypothetical protein
MNRTSILASAMLALGVSAFGCDNATEEQGKASEAQAKADEKITSARAEADDKARSAQAEADRKIAEAQADFLKLRENYRHATTLELADLDKRISDLQAKEAKATGKAKADLDAALPRIRAARDHFAADFDNLETASAATWDAAKANIDKEWADLKVLVAKAE